MAYIEIQWNPQKKAMSLWILNIRTVNITTGFFLKNLSIMPLMSRIQKWF